MQRRQFLSTGFLLSGSCLLGGTGTRGIPNIPVTSHENKKYRFYDDLVKDRIVLIQFLYAECEGICPVMTRQLVKVQRELGGRVGKDIFMYSFTLKPERDDVAALRHYAQMHGIGPGWKLLRASARDTRLVRKRLGFVDSQPEIENDVNQHTGMVRVGNDAIDRWTATPATGPVRAIIRNVYSVDPAMVNWREE